MAEILELLRRGRLRLRRQRSAEGAAAAALPALLLLAAALPAIQLGGLDRAGLPLLLAGAAALVLLGGLAGLCWPVRTLELAYRLDRAHDNADRLGSALEFHALGAARTPLMDAAIRDAARQLPRIDLRRACPWRLPRASRGLLLAGALLAAASVYTAPAPVLPVPPPPRSVTSLLAPAELAWQRELAASLQQDAARLQDEGLTQVARRFQALVGQMERGEIGREAALAELEKLQAATTQPPPGQAPAEQVARQLARAADELKKEQETRALGEALERQDLTAARQELHRLAKLLAEGKVSASMLERLAKAFGGLAKKLAAQLDRQDLEELRQEIGELKQRLGKSGLGGHEQERLRSLEDKLRQALAGPAAGGRGQGKQQGQEPGERPAQDKARDEGLRTLDELHRRIDDAAQKMADAAHGERPERGKPDAQRGQGRGQSQRQQQQQQQQAGQQLAQGASALDRMQRARDQAQARKQAEQRLGQTREVLKREGGNGENAEQRTQQLGEFDRRAQQQGGQPDGPAQRAPDGQQLPPGVRGPGQGQAPTPGAPPPAAAGDRQQGREPGQLSRRGEKDDRQQGNAPDREGLGKATGGRPGVPDGGGTERLAGKRSKDGSSRTEVVQGAAEQGFARVGYRKVYGDFANVAEEELERVQVPAGYRFYVRRYFELIRPRE